MAARIRPCLEGLPSALVRAVRVGCFRIPQDCGDSLSRIMVAFRQLQVLVEGADGGENGPAVLFHFHGHRGLHKPVKMPYYHKLYSWVLPTPNRG